jgi:hypothetical protein
MMIALGLLLMIVSEAATLAQIEPFWSWNTPIAWTGFILFADAVVFRARGQSWMRSAPAELAGLAIASIPLWLVFELYNLYIDNWHYVGLPEQFWLRMFGYAWSFATIWPAIFEGAELVAVWRGTVRPAAGPPAAPTPTARPAQSVPSGLPALSIVVGAACLVWPFVQPSRYLAAPVWLGFIFLLDPINARVSGESLLQDYRHGRWDRLVNLSASGMLCGVLWEFLNYWSRAKWHYTVPFMERFKIFEMPLPGYLGFPAFAIECFTMYVFTRALFTYVASGSRRTPRRAGRAIGLS